MILKISIIILSLSKILTIKVLNQLNLTILNSKDLQEIMVIINLMISQVQEKDLEVTLITVVINSINLQMVDTMTTMVIQLNLSLECNCMISSEMLFPHSWMRTNNIEMMQEEIHTLKINIRILIDKILNLRLLVPLLHKVIEY